MKSTAPSPELDVNINFDLIRNCHPLISVEYIWLNKKNASNLSDYPVKFQLSSLSLVTWNNAERKIDKLFADVFDPKVWRTHKNNLLYIVAFFADNEQTNYNFRHDRENQLKEVARNIYALNDLVVNKKRIKKIVIGKTTLSGDLIIKDSLNAIIQCLNRIYESNLLEKMPAKLFDNVGLKPELKNVFTKKYRRSDSINGIYLGYLAYTIKDYLENETTLKNIGKTNYRTSDDKNPSAMSIAQGNFISELFLHLKLMDINGTPGHLTIRKYIKKFLDDLNNIVVIK